MSGKPQSATNFLNGTNYETLLRFLRQQYVKKLGSVNDRVESRLQKTIQHYMTEVARFQGSGKPVAALNQEVLKETMSSIDIWLKKTDKPAQPAMVTLGSPSRPEDNSRMFEDTTTRYENLLSERAPPTNMMVASVPDFRGIQDTLEVTEDPVILMQRIQKQRDEQARVLGLASTPPIPISAVKDDTPSAANPIPPQASPAPPPLGLRQQDYLIPQDDVVKYVETEFNIFITSSDRDWLKNNKENRYNFSVVFNASPYFQGHYNFNTSIIQRFRNIQRIEFVKAIVPVESLTSLVRVTQPIGYDYPVFDSARVVNIFSLPFASVRIAELNNNNFSTKSEEDNTFAIVQYDTTWSSDLTVPQSYAVPGVIPYARSGYTGLIPKFLKTQKVYAPTPLGTLQKLSIRVEKHDLSLLSSDPDVLDIQRLQMSAFMNHICTADTTFYTTSGLPTVPNAYIFIKIHKYFIHSAASEGDVIQIRGFCVQADGTTLPSTDVDFETFINRQEGHYVIATAWVDAGGNLNLGRNDVGYINVIIIRNRFNDPTMNDPAKNTLRTLSYFGGGEMPEYALAERLSTQDDLVACGLINMSRQTHFALRIITRDVDSAANIRPDNV